VEGRGNAFAEGVESVLFHGLNPKKLAGDTNAEKLELALHVGARKGARARTPEAAGAADGQRVFCLENDICV
jgi:hypothetical protein